MRTKLRNIPLAARAKQLAADGDHTCARLDGGTVRCRPNGLIAQLDTTGATCITVQGAATHLIVDVTGHNG